MKRSLFRKILFYLSVPRCVCCKAKLSLDELAFCSDCYKSFSENLERSCSHCSKRLSTCECVKDNLKTHFIKKEIKLFRYNRDDEKGTLSSLIYALKRSSRYEENKLSADLLSDSIKYHLDDCQDLIFTNVPRRRGGISRFGFDQSARLSKEIAHNLGANYLSLLHSKSKKEQKQLSAEQRLKNVDFSIRKNIDLKNKRVVIVDDIITTGASMASAASLIRSLGTKEIYAASLGIAYYDE